MPQHLLKNINFHSDHCQKHTYFKGGQEIVKPVQKMLIDNKVVCPRCEAERREKQLQESIQSEYEESLKQRKYNILYKKSIIEDNTLLKATIDNYKVAEKEETTNKKNMVQFIESLKSGQTFNVILQGDQGAGKSHLAYAALKELNSNEKSCLFVNVESMVRLIRNSFSDKESKYTENYFVDLMSSVDYLVLDDIGAETGAIDTDKTATNFVQRILYAITTTRQDKSTFITTNLSSETLFNMYDKKLVSRMFKRPKFIIFKETKDKRLMNLPF